MANIDTLYLAIKNAVVQRIQGLNLQGDQEGFGIGDKVYSTMVSDESNIAFPCVVVTTEGERVTPMGGTTEHFYYLFPVRVLVVDHESQRQNDREADYQSWNYAINFAFMNKQLAGVNEVQRCLVDPGVNFGVRPAKYQYLASALLLRFFVRLPRNTDL